MRTGKCVHCLRVSDDITEDHVFPDSWYPETTPGDLQKWKAPACKRCNSELGRLEENLKIKFALCLDPNDPDLKSFVDDAWRAISPQCGRDERDRKARMSKRNDIKKHVTKVSPNAEGIFPNFGPHPDQKNQTTVPGVIIAPEEVQRFGRKVLRGAYYFLCHKYICDHLNDEVYDRFDDQVKFFDDLVIKNGWQPYRSPGLDIMVATSKEMTDVFLLKAIALKKYVIRGIVAPQTFFNGKD